MVTLLALFFALFVFAMTTAGIIAAVGFVNMARFDIQSAADLLQSIYLKPFSVPDMASGPISFILLAIPAVLSFYTIKAIFGDKN